MFLFLVVFFNFCAVKCDSNYYVIQMPVEDPPNDKIPLNSPPFEVYWNVPTMQCTSKKVLFQNLYERFGIIQNEGDSFRGDKIAILYDPGIFPAIFKNETSGKFKFRNGGVPQEGDLEKHLESFRSILNQSVPNEKFNGIGIIDFESWRPIYRQNFGVLSPYKDVSYEIERNNHWWWPTSMVTAEAKRRFEEAARTFMENTVMEAKRLRPLAKWGYYAYPYCFNTKTEKCADKVLAENNHISWLWAQSTALYPSVYSPKDLTASQLSQVVLGRVNEAARAKRGRDVPLLPYFWFRYRDGGYFREDDLQTVLKTFDNSEATGFIIWGSSNDVNTLDKCVKLLNYVEKVLGPAIAKYTKPQNIVGGHSVYTTETIGGDNAYTTENNDGNSSIATTTLATSQVSINNNTYHSENTTAYPATVANETMSEDNEFKTKDTDDTTLNPLTLLNYTDIKQNNSATDTKSSFSLFTLVDSTIIDKINEDLVLKTTEPTDIGTATTDKLSGSDFDISDPEYHWDPPVNYTQDIVKYVEEEFANKTKISNLEPLPITKDGVDENLINFVLDTIFQHKSPTNDSNIAKKIINNSNSTEKLDIEEDEPVSTVKIVTEPNGELEITTNKNGSTVITQIKVKSKNDHHEMRHHGMNTKSKHCMKGHCMSGESEHSINKNKQEKKGFAKIKDIFSIKTKDEIPSVKEDLSDDINKHSDKRKEESTIASVTENETSNKSITENPLKLINQLEHTTESTTNKSDDEDFSENKMNITDTELFTSGADAVGNNKTELTNNDLYVNTTNFDILDLTENSTPHEAVDFNDNFVTEDRKDSESITTESAKDLYNTTEFVLGTVVEEIDEEIEEESIESTTEDSKTLPKRFDRIEKEKRLSKAFDDNAEHGSPVSEELTSSGVTTEQVTGSAAGISANHYLCVLFYFYSVSKCLCELYGQCVI